jgi:large subunit ribosomal protein L21
LVQWLFGGGRNIYAIVETGGKQYRVTQGQILDVDKLEVVAGATVELDRVLVVGEGDKVSIGTPTVEGAKVVAMSRGDGRGEKIIVFKYKPKVRYRRKTGHRQAYTRLAINEIIAPGITAEKPARKRTRRKKEESDSGA